jgi:hypothetical protein
VLWDRVFAAVAAEYPDISTESLLVDAAAMNFIRRPESFDVVVASNLFGDILSDMHGAGAPRQSRSHAPLSFDVRAGARIGARHLVPGES